MSDYGIIRVAKLKQAGNVGGSLGHITREIVPANADPERLAENTLEGGNNTSEMMGKFRELLPDKVRKNAVHALEVLVTASPEKMKEMSREEQDAFFEDSKKFIGEHFGGAKNIFATAIHRDEKTPHMHVLLVPINEHGKLSANTYMKNRETLRNLQDNFGEKVISKHGLKRGVRGSQTRHISPQKWAGIQEKRKDYLEKRQQLHHQPVEGSLADKLKAKANNLAYSRKETNEEHIARLVKTCNHLSNENVKLFDQNERMIKSIEQANNYQKANEEIFKLPENEIKQVREIALEKNIKRKLAREKDQAQKRAAERLARSQRKNQDKGMER